LKQLIAMQALTRQVRRSLPTHSRTHSLTHSLKHKRFVSFNVKETLTTLGPVVNATAELEHSFTQENVNDFATLCGDNNPIHLDAEFASTTRFKAPIVHGVLVSGLISTLFGRVMDGSIYVKQTLNFKNPVHVNGKSDVR
jgi:acyl dehydratase